ncbi:MAG: extracellular solute-binding protein [Anaerolineae bacterium]|nr:extracellular solute-binding protein [Candidatus Roseilinea sp.]MDW8449167.1 extracellular solute-binding protein [Anaerolineae bacterium]
MSPRKTLTRRQFVRLTAGASALAAYLAACQAAPQTAPPAQPAAPAAEEKPADAAPAPASEPVVLRRYASMEKDHFPLFEAQRKQFNEKNPNVTVEEVGVPWGEYITKVRVLLNSGEVPDIFWFMRFGQWDPGIEAATYLKEEIIADVTDIFDTKAAKTFQNIVDAGKVDGKLVGMPFEVFSDGVNWMYNENILNKTGLQPLPQNPSFTQLNDFLTEAKDKVGSDEFAMGPGSWQFWSAFMAASANQPGFHGMVNEDATQSIINSEANVKTVAMLAKFYRTHVLARGDAAPPHLDGMLGGKVMIAPMSTWAPTQMNTAAFEYGSHSGPRYEGVEPRVDGFTGINFWTFARDSKYPKEAADFCYFCGAQEGLDIWAGSGRFAPTDKYTVDDYVRFSKNNNQLGEREKGFRAAVTTNFDVVKHLKTWPVPPKAYWGQFLSKLNEVMEEVVQGKTDDEARIAELLKVAQEETNKVLAGTAA